MTTSDTANKFRYLGNGVTDTFAFSGRIFTTADIKIDIITRATDVLVETLTLSTDYSVTINGDESASVTVTNGAKIPSSLQDILIRRDLAKTQTVDLPTGTVFPSKAVENALDRMTALVQDQSEVNDRTVRIPITSDDVPPTIGSLIADEIVSVSSDGSQLETIGVSASTLGSVAANAAAAASSAGAASTSETNAAASAVAAQAAVGGVKVSSNDTTPGDLESKLLVGAGLSLSTQNDGGNETRTIDQSFASQAEAEAGTATNKPLNALRTKQAIAALAGGGGWVPLQTQTASNDSSVDFTSNIDSTYKAYAIVFNTVIPASDGVGLLLRYSTDGGSSFITSGYSYAGRSHTMSGTDKNTDNSSAAQIQMGTSVGNGTDEGIDGVLYLYDPSAAVPTKCGGTVTGLKETGDLYSGYFAGKDNNAQDVDAIRFLFSGGNISSGTFTLYGLEGA